MNKLYGLYIAEDSDSIFRLMAASNEIEKLKDVVFTPDHCWTICSSVDRERKKMTHTKENAYPYYVIFEIPYIC